MVLLFVCSDKKHSQKPIVFNSECIIFLGLASSAPVQKFKFLDSNTGFQTIRLGSSIIVDCETTDASAVVTLWKLKNSKEIQVQPSLNVIQSGEIFTIHNIALEDIALYRCKAKDSLGANISKDVHVILNTCEFPSLW
jgi:hypothetical protein